MVAMLAFFVVLSITAAALSVSNSIRLNSFIDNEADHRRRINVYVNQEWARLNKIEDEMASMLAAEPEESTDA